MYFLSLAPKTCLYQSVPTNVEHLFAQLSSPNARNNQPNNQSATDPINSQNKREGLRCCRVGKPCQSGYDE